MKKRLCLLIMGLLCMGAGAQTLHAKSMSAGEKEAMREAWGIYQSLFPNKREDALVRDFAIYWPDIKESYLKLKKNELLDWGLSINPGPEGKDVLMKRAQKSIKEHKNYMAYYNAAAVAFVNREESDVWVLSDTDLANVELYAGKAIELGKAQAAPELYLLRARAGMYRFGVWVGYENGDAEKISNHKKEFRPILADLEVVWKKNPAMIKAGLLDVMAAIYAGLGDKENAAKFSKLAAQESERQTQEAMRVNRQQTLARQEVEKMFRRTKGSVPRGHFRSTPAGAPGMFGIGPSR